MENQDWYINSLTYEDFTRALSRDFMRAFCVNTDTDSYVEFFPDEKDRNLDIHIRGKNFSGIVEELIDGVFGEDLDMVRTALTRKNVLKVLGADSSFTLTYRTVEEGRASYVTLKAARIQQDDPIHILIAIKDADAHMQRIAQYEHTARTSLTYADIAESLAADYFCIFYVNTETGAYTEYKSSAAYKRFNVPDHGEDFFETCASSFVEQVFAEDREIFLKALDPENVRRVLSVDRLLMLTFRIMINGRPNYIRLKVTRMQAEDNHHIVVGLSDVDASMRRSEAYRKMKKIVHQDALTGAKNKNAYLEAEERLNRQIGVNSARDFALVICDVNGLKKINDSQGHQAGDEYIRCSCKMIGEVFPHTPVYRIGGDEFAVLLAGSDYDSREERLRRLHELSVTHIGTGGAIVSGGMAEYLPGKDRSLHDIFERADAAMYREKQLLKSLGATTREEGAQHPG